ncbi:MAG: diguanylate cyclase/phosphodiesterase [Deltaproteobacteria bacterium]|nr:diguanylate cyclase/phosphodiesterase [Deltaproteobacteria bacterium]
MRSLHGARVRRMTPAQRIVSHDLRNPLSAIDLSVMNLLDEPTAPSVTRRLEIIRRAAGRMKRLIDDLLDMATIEAKGLTLDRTSHDADRILETVIEAHEPIAAAKGIALRREGRVTTESLWCDRGRVEQVFADLIGNAIKYGRSGDVISISGSVEDCDVRFSVAEAHGGKLWVESTPGIGSKFSFTIPRVAALSFAPGRDDVGSAPRDHGAEGAGRGA